MFAIVLVLTSFIIEGTFKIFSNAGALTTPLVSITTCATSTSGEELGLKV